MHHNVKNTYFSNTTDRKRTLIALWLKMCVNNKHVRMCVSLLSVLSKHFRCVAVYLHCFFLMCCVGVFAARFLDAAHVLAKWWRCFLNLLVFFLFACVFLICSAVSSQGHRTTVFQQPLSTQYLPWLFRLLILVLFLIWGFFNFKVNIVFR